MTAKVKPLFDNSDKTINSNFIQNQIRTNQHVTATANNLVVTQEPIKTGFNPVSPKQLADLGASSQRVVNLLSTFDSPTGILEFGQDVMTKISTKSTQLLDEVKDADVEFVQKQMSGLLTMAKSFHLNPGQKKKGLHGLISKAKEVFIDTKEQLLAEYNDISTQMDRIIGEVELANSRIINKVKSLQIQYAENLKDYNELEQIIKDATEAFQIKTKELEKLQATATDVLAAEEVARLARNLDRLDKKIANFKKFQLMCLQDAPDFANMEDSAITLLEKFGTIKTMVIPLWKRQIRKYIDGQEIARAAKLSNAVDDATNEMIVASSNANKQTAIEVAKLGQRLAIDDNTAEVVHQNLIDTLNDVLEINNNGRQARITSANRQDEMKRMYAQIAIGK